MQVIATEKGFVLKFNDQKRFEQYIDNLQEIYRYVLKRKADKGADTPLLLDVKGNFVQDDELISELKNVQDFLEKVKFIKEEEQTVSVVCAECGKTFECKRGRKFCSACRK